MFNWVDYAIVGLILFSVLISIVRGFFREALSLLTWITSVWVSFHFAKDMSLVLQPYLPQTTIRIAASFIILFVLTLIAGSMISFIISRMVSRAGLGGFDRMLGILFGFIRGVLFASVILLVGKAIVPTSDPLWAHSLLAGYFVPIETFLVGLLPNEMNTPLKQHTLMTQNVSAPSLNLQK